VYCDIVPNLINTRQLDERQTYNINTISLSHVGVLDIYDQCGNKSHGEQIHLLIYSIVIESY